MARSRIIKPGFFENKKLALCSPHARLLFIGLWQQADRDGRVRYTENGLKGRIFQYEDKLKVGAMLCELQSGGFLDLYRSDSELYLEILNFSKHQHIHSNENSNNYPSHNDLGDSEQSPDKVRNKSEQKLDSSTSSSYSTSTSNSTLSGLPDIPFKEIIDDLNRKAGKKFRHTGSATQDLIKARWAENYRLDDFKKVHDNKVRDWGGNLEFNKFLRPETLYRPKHFESYLNEKPDNEVNVLVPNPHEGMEAVVTCATCDKTYEECRCEQIDRRIYNKWIPKKVTA